MDTSYNILQAVSVVVNPREASGLALSWTRIRDGIIARKGGSCKMYSIVEDPKFHKSEAALSLLEFMRKEGLIVRPVSDMQSLAAEAAIAMRLS